MSLYKIIKNRLRLFIRRCTPADKQLQKKFNKHAGDFGITGNYNSDNREKFRQAIKNHLTDENTILIKGTYRNDSVSHYYNTIKSAK